MEMKELPEIADIVHHEGKAYRVNWLSFKHDKVGDLEITIFADKKS